MKYTARQIDEMRGLCSALIVAKFQNETEGYPWRVPKDLVQRAESHLLTYMSNETLPEELRAELRLLEDEREHLRVLRAWDEDILWAAAAA